MQMLQILLRRGLASFVFLGIFISGHAVAQANTLLGVNCANPPVWHCPDSDCPTAVVTQPGDTVDIQTRRTYFLDCPSDCQPGDKVSIFLSLHGFGSFANWQRNYFPAMDVKDKYKLIVITPGSPVRYWTEDDDQYLMNLVDNVVYAVGKENVENFILAGHSQGGITASRLVCTDYFKDKVDVRISFSGGRTGPVIPAGKGFADGGSPVYRSGEADAVTAPLNIPGFPEPAGPAGGPCDYSYIFAVGANEQLPGETSPLAEKYSCDSRVKLPDVIDPKKGYVWDASRQDPGTDGWGRYPKSGRAEVYVYPNCEDGRVIADVAKLQKGHTEGYEPNVTDKIIELALSAKGGKIANGNWMPPEPPARPRGPFSR